MNTVIPMPAPKMDWTLNLQDDLLLARPKRSEKTDTRLEIDSFYLPMPVQEDKLSAPFGAHMGLLVDKDAGGLLDQNIARLDEPDYVVAPTLLIDYMEEHGRPAAVYVRSEWMGSLLRSTCKAVGVRLVENESVPVLDSFWDNFMGSLMGGFSMDNRF